MDKFKKVRQSGIVTPINRHTGHRVIAVRSLQVMAPPPVASCFINPIKYHMSLANPCKPKLLEFKTMLNKLSYLGDP